MWYSPGWPKHRLASGDEHRAHKISHIPGVDMLLGWYYGMQTIIKQFLGAFLNSNDIAKEKKVNLWHLILMVRLNNQCLWWRPGPFSSPSSPHNHCSCVLEDQCRQETTLWLQLTSFEHHIVREGVRQQVQRWKTLTFPSNCFELQTGWRTFVLIKHREWLIFDYK